MDRRIKRRALIRLLLTLTGFGSEACAARSPGVRETTSNAVENPECYNLAYMDPIKNAAARWFPIWLELLPGTDSGSVVGRPHPEFNPREWAAMNTYRWWKKIPGDSIEVNFSGNFEAIHIHVKRVGSRLVGRATYLSDIVEPDPQPSMHVDATSESCPVPRPAA